MFKNVFLFVIFLGLSMSTFSQEKKKTTQLEELPESIYAVDWSKTFSFKSTTLKEDLRLEKFVFLIVDAEDIRNNFFTVDFRNIGRKATSYSYESYKNIDLYKHFPRIYDLRTIPWKNNY